MTYFTTTQLLEGKPVADKVLAGLEAELKLIAAKKAPMPNLVVVLVGEDAASQVYVNKKAKVATKIGMRSEVRTLPADTTQDDLLAQIDQLNADADVHAILVQLPLPSHLNSLEVINRIDPAKDADGLHPLNMGKLLLGQPVVAQSCTPAGIMTMLKQHKIPLAGKHAVIVGRSNIVGKPMAHMLLAEHCTVTLCHSRTEDLPTITRQADILVAAVGIPHYITADHVKEGAVVIDVGINRLEGKLVGDVDFEAVSAKSSFITPVPGGVGPMTIATLMANTLALYQAAQLRR